MQKKVKDKYGTSTTKQSSKRIENASRMHLKQSKIIDKHIKDMQKMSKKK